MKRLWVALLPMLLAASAGATEPAETTGDTARLTLAEAVERAVSVSARLRELGQLQLAADADLGEARGGRLPSTNLTASYTRRSDIPEFLFPTAPGEPSRGFPNLPDNYTVGVRASLPLYTGGRISGGIDAARERQQAAGLDVEAGRRNLTLEVQEAYWGLVTARASERVLREALSAFAAHMKDAENRERFGLAARSEVLAVQVEDERAELRRLKADNAAQIAEANLQRLLQLPPETRIEPTEPVEREGAEPGELEGLVTAALEARPERSGLMARLRAAEARIGIERSGHLPQARFSAGYVYANPNRNYVPPDESWRDSWDVGVEVSLKVFDGGRTSASVARARATAEGLRQRLDDLERGIRLEVTRAYLDLKATRVAVGVAEQALGAARESHRVSAERYREGVIPSSELLDAEVALLDAGLNHTQALAEVQVAAARLDRAVAR